MDCLEALSAAGRFLPLESPPAEREGAGEARKLQAWEAALAACEAGQPVALAWILRSGWGSLIDINIPWHVRDMVPQWEAKLLEAARIVRRLLRHSACQVHKFLPGIALCHAVVTSPTAACLDVLLRAGCRSKWLCTLAAEEGREDCFWAAEKAGCPVTQDALTALAHQGNDRQLSLLCSCGYKIRPSRRKTNNSQAAEAYGLFPGAVRGAIEGGHVRSMEILLTAHQLSRSDVHWLCVYAIEDAAELGRLDCLKAAHRCVPRPHLHPQRSALGLIFPSFLLSFRLCLFSSFLPFFLCISRISREGKFGQVACR